MPLSTAPHPRRTGRELLAREAAKCKLALPEADLDALAAYLDLLRQWGARINLTGYKTPKAMVRHLFLESLVLDRWLPEHTRALDVGSGAGFPALPLKLRRPAVPWRLVEPRRKKGMFLQEVAARLGLEGVVVDPRSIQEVAHDPNLTEGFDLITIRGFDFRWKDLAPLLAPGGTLALITAQGKGNALKAARPPWVGFAAGHPLPYGRRFCFRFRRV